ncbi:MAG: hypothetical protein J7L62_04075 [Candidatus Aminicenantes bacterium]|nr:hypothetical protein [Candidatus Aminicenantes bacterium]
MKAQIKIKGDVEKFKEEIINGLYFLERGEKAYSLIHDSEVVLQIERVEESSDNRLAEAIEELTDTLKDLRRTLGS